MTTEQIAAGVVAVTALFWPKLAAIVKGLLPAPAGPSVPVPAPVPVPGVVPVIPASTVVTFEAAVHNLALVRTRLVKTELLDDPTKKSIDTLTLQLVAGSDK